MHKDRSVICSTLWSQFSQQHPAHRRGRKYLPSGGPAPTGSASQRSAGVSDAFLAPEVGGASGRSGVSSRSLTITRLCELECI